MTQAVWLYFLVPRDGPKIGLRGCFFVKVDVRGGPRRSRGVPGVCFGRKSRENKAGTPRRQLANPKLPEQLPEKLAGQLSFCPIEKLLEKL